jgi:hypothetical protein
MSSFLQNLENNEAILLMYLANELPAEDREEVEQMLQADANLRDQLNQLRGAYHHFDQTMLLGDASTPVASGYMTAQRFGESVRNRYTVPRSVDDHDDAHRRFHWAMYPVAAAALLAIGMLVWFKTASANLNKPATLVGNNSRNWSGGGMGPGGQFDPWGRSGEGRGRWRQPMVDFSTVPATADAAAMTEEEIELAFEPVVLPRRSAALRQLAALDYLDEKW